MMKHNLFLFFITAILLLPGCAKKNKKKQKPYLRSLSSYIDYHETHNQVVVRAKKLSLDDCKSLFGKRAKFLFKKNRRKQPIYPIQLSITNNTESAIALRPANISLELTSFKEVLSRVEENSALQAVGGIACAALAATLLVAGGIFALTSGGMITALFGSIGAMVAVPLVVAGLSAAIVTPFFLVIGTPILSTIKGMQSAHTNSAMRQEIEDKSLNTELVISQGQTVDTIIFVSQPKYQRNFIIYLTEPKTANQVANFYVELQEDYHE